MSASKVRETPNGVKYVDIAKGEGLTPKQGDFVVITYTGCTSCVWLGVWRLLCVWLWLIFISPNNETDLPDGTIFDSLHAKGKKPLAFKIGTKQVRAYDACLGGAISSKTSRSGVTCVHQPPPLQVIPGLEEALASMQPGGERQILVRCVVLVLMGRILLKNIPIHLFVHSIPF